MAEQATKIIGVDFSGAERSNTTWVAKGTLIGNVLELESCRRLGKRRGDAHQKLEDELKALPKESVAAMDFPFSVPEEFIEYWCGSDELLASPEDMTELWKAAQRLKKSNTELEKWCKKFVDSRKNGELYPEPKRRGDLYQPASFSPLHRNQPDMVPMTFRGMQMLHRLYNAEESSFRVPPLSGKNHCGPTLLEVMPGSVLISMGLPYQNYKENSRSKKGEKFHKNFRSYIWDKLTARSGIIISMKNEADLDNLGEKVKNNKGGDCLDAVIAAVAASIWSLDKKNFHCPPKKDPPHLSDRILKEGWLYTPCPNRLPVSTTK